MWKCINYSKEDKKWKMRIIINIESNSNVQVPVSEEDRKKWNTWIINIKSNSNVKVLVSEEEKKWNTLNNYKCWVK